MRAKTPPPGTALERLQNAYRRAGRVRLDILYRRLVPGLIHLLGHLANMRGQDSVAHLKKGVPVRNGFLTEDIQSGTGDALLP